jgi:CBS domain-containing membrane protein
LEVLEGLLRRLRLTWLLKRFPARPVWAFFVCGNSIVAIALLSVVAMISGTAVVFTSLGPTAYLLFFTPRAPAASPKHALWGHLIGLACGWGALWITGLTHAPPVTMEGVTKMRILAAALSLGVTAAAMVLLHVSHPPAGATTLIVSLGFITRPWELVVIEAAVAALLVHATIMNRLAGIDYPLWAPKKGAPVLPRPPVD